MVMKMKMNVYNDKEEEKYTNEKINYENNYK